MQSESSEHVLFPEIEALSLGLLALDELHTMYWEESGHSKGLPVYSCMAGRAPVLRRSTAAFSIRRNYRIVLYDQRGSGKSLPHAELRDNTRRISSPTWSGCAQHLGIESWLVFGGSWAARWRAYAEAACRSCLGLILRGIFLCRATEVELVSCRHGAYFPRALAALCRVPARG